MEKSLRYRDTPLYSWCPRVLMCTRVTFGQFHHYLLGKPSIVRRRRAGRLPICLVVAVLQHFISPRYRHASHQSEEIPSLFALLQI